MAKRFTHKIKFDEFDVPCEVMPLDSCRKIGIAWNDKDGHRRDLVFDTPDYVIQDIQDSMIYRKW